MENEKVEKIQIYSCQKVWKIEHSIYSVGNINLPVPVQPSNLLYFCGTFAIMALLCKLFPVLYSLPFVLRVFAIPYGITVFLRKKKLDGKNPIKYLIAWIKYELFENGKYFERFEGFSDRSEQKQINWLCSMKYHRL